MDAITDIIAWAKAAQPLSRYDITISKALSGGKLDERHPELLRMERMSLEYLYEQNPTSDYLPVVGDYVKSLIGKYLFVAQRLVNGSGGGVIVNPVTGSGNTFGIPHTLAFAIGDSDSPMANGDTVLVITEDNIDESTLSVIREGTHLLKNRTDRLSYTLSVERTRAVITFNQIVETPQAFIIDYFTL